MSTWRRSIAILATEALLLCGTAHAETFDYATYLPAHESVIQFGVGGFADQVEGSTEGRVSFEIRAGGSLLGVKDMVSGIRSGKADGGFIITAFVDDALAHVRILGGLVALADNSMQASGASAETILIDCPECMRDYADMNAVYVAGIEPSAYWLQCAAPIRGPRDMMGKKVRVASPSTGRWIKHLGGIPKRLPPKQMLPSMRAGEFDCAIALPSWLISHKLNETVRQVVTTPQGSYHSVGTFVFNRDFWNARRQEDTRAIVEAAVRNTTLMLEEANFGGLPEQLQETIAENGISVLSTDRDFEESWKSFQSSEAEAVIVEAVERGVDEAVARRIVAAHLDNLRKWSRITEDVGSDRARYEQALWDNVYSKASLH